MIRGTTHSGVLLAQQQEIICHHSLPIKGRLTISLLHYEFPSEWHIPKTVKHCSNEQNLLEYFDNIVLLCQ